MVKAITPFGVFENSTTPEPGRNYTVIVHVPTTAVSIQVVDYWGDSVNCTVKLLANGSVVASGRAPLSAVVLSGTYNISVTASINGLVLNYDEAVRVPPGRYDYTVRLPTAELFVYPQTPLGAPLRNATVIVSRGGAVVVNSTGPQRLVLLAGTYEVLAEYANSTSKSVVTLRPGDKKPVYLNLSATIGPIIKVAPNATTTTTMTSATRLPSTVGTTPPMPPATTTTSRTATTSAWDYALVSMGSLAAALAVGVLVLSLMALRGAED